MPSTTTPRRQLRLTDAQYARVHDIYAADLHLLNVRLYVETLTGRNDLTDAQLLLAVGVYGWRMGTDHGNQSYQQRMTRLGRNMRLLGRRGEAAGTAAPVVDAYGAAMAELANVAATPTARRFGIEVEFNRGTFTGYGDRQRSEIVAAMCANGISSYLDMTYHHRTPTEWRMSYDQTTTGGEFISPILTADAGGFHEVREAIRAVKAAGGSAGQGQGMHVHHDVSDFTAAEMPSLVRNLRLAERALLAYVPAYRYNGSGSCRATLIGEHGWNRYEREAANGILRPGHARGERDHYNRYTSFNFCAVLVQGSVEFRALGNTLNPVKVWTWVQVGSALISYTKAGHVLANEVTAEELANELVATGFLDARQGERFINECERRHGTRTAMAA